MQVYDSGVHIPQVDDSGVAVSLLMQDGVRAYEEEDANAHDQGSQDLQPVRVQVPAATTGGGVGHCVIPQKVAGEDKDE